jgi:ATP-binding cassette, subfamily C (CFTR/MRP), member 1
MIASSLFKDVNKKLFNAPINKYFDITPQGVILNRLSKDYLAVDMFPLL